MAAYIKKIAVIKQVKSGFSADGGNISRLVKAETYAGFLKVEVSLINFAPITEGRYVLGITDGLNTVIFDGLSYEGETEFSLSSGFAFLVCFCHNTVAPIASAACGQMACALPDLKEEMTKRENIRPQRGGAAYDDEAISEVNYYERSVQSGAAVRAAETKKEERNSGGEDEAAACSVKSEKEGRGARTAAGGAGGEPSVGGLAGGDFYSRMEADIKKIFAAYPKEAALEKAMEGGRFVKIAYGNGKYYVFGVLSIEGKPRYICYGVPSQNPDTPPPSLKDCASFVPVDGGGYWMTYQDASTGISVTITNA